MGVSCAVLRFGMSAPLRLEVPVQRETERESARARSLLEIETEHLDEATG